MIFVCFGTAGVEQFTDNAPTATTLPIVSTSDHLSSPWTAQNKFSVTMFLEGLNECDVIFGEVVKIVTTCDRGRGDQKVQKKRVT